MVFGNKICCPIPSSSKIQLISKIAEHGNTTLKDKKDLPMHYKIRAAIFLRTYQMHTHIAMTVTSTPAPM